MLDILFCILHNRLLSYSACVGSCGQWETNSPAILEVGPSPITSLAIGGSGILYAASGTTIAVIDADSTEIERSFEVEAKWENGRVQEAGHVTHLACAGLGLWVARADSTHLWVYHTETCTLIQAHESVKYTFRIKIVSEPLIIHN